MKIDICFSPILYPFYKSEEDTIVIVTDIFRATTTMCAALNNGAKSIIPVESVEEAKDYKTRGYLVGGERNVKRCEFADFGNSPFEYAKEIVDNKDIVISTTNGTRAIDVASSAYKLAIGSFSNLDAIAEFCLKEKKNILILCSGWQNKFNFEDTLFGGALASILISKRNYNKNSDSLTVALKMWKEAESNILEYVKNSEHYQRLVDNNLQKDIEYCLSLNTLDIVPIYNIETKKITILQ